MNFTKLALTAAALTAMPAAAFAQDAGVTVYGNDDAPIGTVETNADGIVTVNTGTHMAPLPADLLAEREGKWTVNATKAQIDAMMADQVAKADEALNAALVEGAALISADSQPAGVIHTVDSANDQIVVMRDGGIVALKREHFTVDANGALMALFTVEQLAANTTEVPEGAEIVTAAADAQVEASTD